MTNTDWPTTELAREWTHRGITCRVYVADYFNNGYKRPNGYVELPEDHPARHLNLQWDDCEVFDVHGGITYGGDGGRVIGWDTAHSDDNWEGDPSKPGRIWTVNDAAEETTRLADQVADLYTPESIAMFKASTRLCELADELDPTKETHA